MQKHLYSSALRVLTMLCGLAVVLYGLAASSSFAAVEPARQIENSNPVSRPLVSRTSPGAASLKRLAADEGCAEATPNACPGANMCCTVPSTYYCENYQGPVVSMRGKSGCVANSTSDEGLKDYSVSCTAFIHC